MSEETTGPTSTRVCVTITDVDIPFDRLLEIGFKLLAAQVVVLLIIGIVVGVVYGLIVGLAK